MTRDPRSNPQGHNRTPPPAFGRYDRDPRVRRDGNGYRVTTTTGEHRVQRPDLLGWGVVDDNTSRPATRYAHAEDAIHALIGDPK